MPDSAGYLPPVVARIVGDISDLVRKLEEAKALLGDFASKVHEAKLGANDDPLMVDLSHAQAELIDFSHKTYNVTIDANTAPALAEIQALKDEIAAMKSDVRVGARPTAGSLAGGGLGALFGHGGSSALGGLLWGATGGGFMSRLFSPLTTFSQLFSAGFGSAGAFAGFSPEHLAMTAGGLAGLGVEGGLGAGLLGLGSAGVSGAGALADAGGLKQAAGDIRNVVTAQNNLSRAIAEYGKNSKQAAEAQNLVNYQLSGFSPIARQAVAAAAATAHEFGHMYDRVTGQAEKIGAGILRQGMLVGEAFLPELGRAATRNMGIIQKGLQPLFTWLKSQGGGLGIFTNLENIFTSRLPTAVKLFDNGLELLLRTINLIAPQTGRLVASLARLAANANGSGWSRYASHVEHLIADFRLLEGFFKALGHDLISVFKDDAGEPQAIIAMWTASLQRLGHWIDSINGKAKIRLLFQVHKSEMLDILHIIGELATSFGHVYMAVAPAFVSAVNTMLTAVNPFLKAFVKNPFGAWVVGLALIASRFGPLRSMIGSLIPRLGAMAAGMLGLSAAEGAEAATSGVASVAAAALNIALGVGIIGAIIALGVAIFELVKHWHTVWATIKSVTSTVTGAVAGFVSRMWHDITSFVSRIYHDVTGFFSRMWHDVTSAVSTGVTDVIRFFVSLATQADARVSRIVTAVTGFFSRMWHDVTSFASRIYHDVTGFFTRMWTDVKKGVTTGISDVLTWLGALPGKIEHFFANAGSWLLNAGKAIIDGLWNGLKSAWNDVTGFFSGIGSWISKHKGPIEVDRQLLVPHGRAIMAGLYQGLTEGYGQVQTLVGGMNAGITGGLSTSLSGVRGASSNPQLARIENLLTNLLGEAKATTKNTEATVTTTRGLSSPTGVAAQIAASNARLVTSLRVGV